MPSINLEQGILAIQQQDLATGNRLLKFALKNDPLDNQERVRALTWLAETDPNPQFKLTQYQQAIQLDPTNQDILSRLTHWSQKVQQNQFNASASQSMPAINAEPTFGHGLTPSQPMNPINAQPQFGHGLTPSQPMQAFNQAQVIRLETVQRTVGIVGGANGDGTGFFVTRDGLIATSRHIVGGEREILVQLLDGRQLTGNVVQSFPNLDLSLIQLDVQLAHLLGISQAPTIPDDMKIVAVTHAGEGIGSSKRRSMNKIEDHWFPTVINHLKDAGGNPIFDNKNLLVGMLTNNASRTNGYMYGLHIYKIYQCIDQYIQEKNQLQGQRTIYCRDCGIISRAPAFGGYYCEHCGVTHPYAMGDTVHRTPQKNLAQLYNENTQRPCPNCNSQVGFYNRACMRCGHQL